MKCPHTNRPVSNVVLILETSHLDLLYCSSVVLTFSIGLVKYRWLDLTPRVSVSVGLRWGLRMCISDKFPGDAESAGPGTTLWEALVEFNGQALESDFLGSKTGPSTHILGPCEQVNLSVASAFSPV